MAEHGLYRAVEIDIFINTRHQRLDALRELAEHGEFVLTQIALIAPVFGNDQIFEKCAIEEEKLGFGFVFPLRVVEIEGQERHLRVE